MSRDVSPTTRGVNGETARAGERDVRLEPHAAARRDGRGDGCVDVQRRDNFNKSRSLKETPPPIIHAVASIRKLLPLTHRRGGGAENGGGHSRGSRTELKVEGWRAKESKKSKVSGWMTENKGSGELKKRGGMNGAGRGGGRDAAVERRRRKKRKKKKKRGGCEAGRVTFTVRADQFPVPSIIDVTSAVGCYLSGLTNRNTIPTGSAAARTHVHARTHTRTLKQVQHASQHTIN